MKALSILKMLLLLCLSAILWFDCKKNNANPDGLGATGFDSSAPVAVTGVGTPIGSPITKNIGAAGGTITSVDGNLVLTIPAGALATYTNITIQPVTSTMPASAGLAYSLLPNGTKFNVPVTISFHYTPDQFPDNNPEFSFIAYQDSVGSWKADAKQRDWDTTAKTVSLQVSHFTTFDMGQWLKIMATSKTTLQADEKCYLTIFQYFFTEDIGDRILHIGQQLPDQQIDSWQVNDIVGGTPFIGTVTKTTHYSAIYEAPANITEKKTVFVKCITKVHEIIFKNGKQYEDHPHLSASIAINLIPYYEYNLTVKYWYRDSSFSNLYGILKPSSVPVYVDTMQFDVNLKINLDGVIEKVTNIINGAPVVSPTHAVTVDETFDWLPDPNGVVNADQIFTSGGLAFDLTPDSIIGFNVYHHMAQYPGYLVRNNFSGQIQTVVPNPYAGVTGVPATIGIDLKKIPYFESTGGLGIWEDIQVIQRQ